MVGAAFRPLRAGFGTAQGGRALWAGCFVRSVRDSAPHAADELRAPSASFAPCPIFIRFVRDFRAISAPCGVSVPHAADESPEYDVSSAPCPRTQRTKREKRTNEDCLLGCNHGGQLTARSGRKIASHGLERFNHGAAPHVIPSGTRSAEPMHEPKRTVLFGSR